MVQGRSVASILCKAISDSTSPSSPLEQHVEKGDNGDDATMVVLESTQEKPDPMLLEQLKNEDMVESAEVEPDSMVDEVESIDQGEKVSIAAASTETPEHDKKLDEELVGHLNIEKEEEVRTDLVKSLDRDEAEASNTGRDSQAVVSVGESPTPVVTSQHQVIVRKGPGIIQTFIYGVLMVGVVAVAALAVLIKKSKVLTKIKGSYSDLQLSINLENASGKIVKWEFSRAKGIASLKKLWKLLLQKLFVQPFDFCKKVWYGSWG